MASHTHFYSRTAHPRRSLLVRGGLARTFGSLASFLALVFLGFGFYILQDAFADPLAAQSSALVAAAFIIALASIILFYLFKPRRSLRTQRVRHREEIRPNSWRSEEEFDFLPPNSQENQLKLPYQRRSTDRVHLQP